MSVHDCSGKRRFGQVRIEWTCSATARNCRVAVWWRDSLILPATLSAAQPQASFSVVDEDDPGQRVAGEFRLDPSSGVLLLVYLIYPGGAPVRDERLCPQDSPPPPPPEPDTPDEVAALAVRAETRDLFPYIFLRGWPPAPPVQRADRFVPYAAACAVGDRRFYCRLLAVDPTAPDARAQRVQLALDFIAGTLDGSGPFLPGPPLLPPPLDRFSAARADLLRAGPLDLAGFIAQLCAALDMDWPALVSWMGSPEAAAAIDQVWQSVFALCIELGYDRAGLAGLIGTLVLAALLQRIVATLPPPDAEADAPEGVPACEDWPARRLREGLLATLVLPPPVFPLPPGPLGATPDAARPLRSILPFAVGELQLARERLLRYEAGEVAHIENVMPGERRLRRQRERQRSEQVALESLASDTDQIESGDARSQAFERFARQALDARFRVDYSTQYGPPSEATATGHVELLANPDAVPTRSTQEQRAALARQVTQQASRRLAQRLGALRGERLRHERESELAQVIDRRGCDRGARGIYRWLNAVHRCWVEPVGRRLVLELFLPEPARDYIAARMALAGIALSRPQPLAQCGVASFEDISLDPESPTYYARLAAQYGMDTVEPPPPLRQVQGVVFESDPPQAATVLALPEGYLACEAIALLVSDTAGLGARLSIGASSASVAQLDAGAQPVPIPLQGQRGNLTLAFGLVPPSGASASVQGGEPTPRFTLTLQVQSEASPALLARWRAQVYAGLQQAYRRQLDAYLDASGMRLPPQTQGNALARSSLVRGEVERCGLRAFVELARRRSGESGRVLRFLPALTVWLRRALEWSGMSLSLIDRFEDEAGAVLRVDDAGGGLADFLQAAYARVLLPVAPGHELGLLFFLASGMVWDESDALAPCFETPVLAAEDGAAAGTWLDVANAWKSAQAAPEGVDEPPSAWDVILPTTLTLLQEGEDLPAFDPKGA